MERPEAARGRGRRPRVWPGLAVVALVTGALTGLPQPSGAASTYSATAAGEVFRVLVRVEPPVLQADLIDPGALSAQASFTSFGESTAFASDPYPGSLPVAMPGLMDGLIDGTQGFPPELAKAIDLPDYPFIASSSYPNTPSAKVTAGPVVLTGDSEERASQGVAVDGGNRTEARVSADTATDTVTSRATAQLDSVDLGSLMTMRGVRSAAQVVQTAGGERKRSSEFSVASLVVLGQALRVTPAGLELAGLNVPVGGGAGSIDSLLKSLEEQGVSLRFLAATDTADGILSAGLLVSRKFDAANGAVTTVQSTIGRTYAATANTARPLPKLGDFPAGDGLGTFPSGGGVSPPAPGSDAPPGSLSPAPPAGDGGAGGYPPAPPAVKTAAPAGAPAGDQVAAAPLTAAVPARGLVPDRTDAGRFYPVLVLGGALLAIAVSLFRKIGVKPTWS
jgi:hypothetical protein